MRLTKSSGSSASIEKISDTKSNRRLIDHDYSFFPSLVDKAVNLCSNQEEEMEDNPEPKSPPETSCLLNEESESKDDPPSPPTENELDKEEAADNNRKKDSKPKMTSKSSSLKSKSLRSPKNVSQQNKGNGLQTRRSTKVLPNKKRKLNDGKNSQSENVEPDDAVEGSSGSMKRLNESEPREEKTEEIKKIIKKKIIKEIVAWIPTNPIAKIQPGTYKPLMVLDGVNKFSSKSTKKLAQGSQVIFTKDESVNVSTPPFTIGTTPGLDLIKSEVESMQTTIVRLTQEVEELKKRERTLNNDYNCLSNKFEEFRTFAEKKVAAELKSCILERISANHFNFLMGEYVDFQEWTSDEIKNAQTLFEYSQPAYNFVRNVLRYPLPNLLQLRRFSLQQKAEFTRKLNLTRIKKRANISSNELDFPDDESADGSAITQDLAKISELVSAPRANGSSEIELHELRDNSDTDSTESVIEVEALSNVLKDEG